MEPRSATEAPLLLHTCEERARAPPRLPPSQQAHHGQGSTSTTTGNKHAVVPNLEAGLNLSPVSWLCMLVYLCCWCLCKFSGCGASKKMNAPVGEVALELAAVDTGAMCPGRPGWGLWWICLVPVMCPVDWLCDCWYLVRRSAPMDLCWWLSEGHLGQLLAFPWLRRDWWQCQE